MPQRQILTDELAIGCNIAMQGLEKKYKVHIKYPLTNRFFHTIKEEDGRMVDSPMAPDDTVASEAQQKEFYQSILDGTAYFYPIDSKDPVHLSLEARPDQNPRFVFKEAPIDKTPPKKPGIFKQFFHKVFNAFKKDFADYEKAVMAHNYITVEASERRQREIGDGERKQYTDHAAAMDIAQKVEIYEKNANWISGCMTRLDATMGPKFRQTEDLLAANVYTPDFKLPDYKKPERFTERECSLVALSVFTDPQVGGLEIEQGSTTPEHRVHGNYSFVAEGFFTAYRKGIGKRGYTPGLEQARLLGAEAMEKFNQGDPKELARYIGLAIRENNINIIPKDRLSQTVASYAQINTELLDMLYKYPELKQCAMENNYLHAEDLQKAEMGRGIVKLYQDVADSRLRLVKATQEGRELTVEEKTACIANMVAFQKMSNEFSYTYNNSPEKEKAVAAAEQQLTELVKAKVDMKSPEAKEASALMDEASYCIKPSKAMLKLSDTEEVQKLQSGLKEFQAIKDVSRKSTKELFEFLSEASNVTDITKSITKAVQSTQPTVQEPQNVRQAAPQQSVPVKNTPQVLQ